MTSVHLQFASTISDLKGVNLIDIHTETVNLCFASCMLIVAKEQKALDKHAKVLSQWQKLTCPYNPQPKVSSAPASVFKHKIKENINMLSGAIS